MIRYLALAFVVLATSVAGCQESGDSRNIARVRFGGQKWAILVGIDDYSNVKDLRYCGADMRALRDRLVASGFPKDHVIVLHDEAPENRFKPFKSNIEQQLELVLKLAGKDDMVVLAFSGHGVHLEGGSYLCPIDAQLDDPVTLVSLEKIYGQMKDSAAALKLILVDACRNDPKLGGQKGLAESTKLFADAIKGDELPKGSILLNSCTAGEVSWEDENFKHGVFMHFLLEGLKGKADDNKSGDVTLSELSKYVNYQTKKHVFARFNSSQQPFLRGEFTLEAMEFSFGTIGGGDNRPAMPMTLPAEGTKAGEVRRFNEALNLPMAWCPPGQFTMGSPPGEAGRDDDEDQLQVTLSRGYWLACTEVTQSQWKSVMPTQPWRVESTVADGDDFPATNVSWEDAVKFCEALTKREVQAERLRQGDAYRLPTEAQWEYACRAGTDSAYSFGDDARQLAEFGWFGAVGATASAHEVGQKRPNAWGLFDMHGNVAEWCRDEYHERYDATAVIRPAGQELKRVLRGGAWNMGPELCRSAVRYAYFDYGPGRHGFRIVLELTK
ncbi:MAG: SUMF1/EgtB/PvdO family nonheme iron enzyme [Planctomycetota bacterium]